VQYAVGPSSVQNNLSGLQSYRTHLTVDFSGNRNGGVVKGNIDVSTEVTQEPAALHYTFRLEGQVPKIPAGVSEYYRLGDRVYLKKAGDTLWSQFSGANTTPTSLGFLDLEKLIALPASAVSTPPVTETLNGLPVTHYTFNETDLSDPSLIFDQAQGEVWVASPGDYVVNYVISTTQRVTWPAPTHLFDEGQLTLHYEMKDVNGDFTINPPADFPTTNVLTNLPRLPDAEIVAAFPDLIEYVSSTTPISATQFYQNELAAQDWTEETVAVFAEKARLVFSKDDQTLSIIIIPLDAEQKGGQNIKVLLDIK